MALEDIKTKSTSNLNENVNCDDSICYDTKSIILTENRIVKEARKNITTSDYYTVNDLESKSTNSLIENDKYEYYKYDYLDENCEVKKINDLSQNKLYLMCLIFY